MSATPSALYRFARLRFEQAGISLPDLDARLLVREACGCTIAQLLSETGMCVSPVVEAQVVDWINRRLAGEPVDRILGEREFWGMRFRLTPETLSPRPDTETLVEVALSIGAPVNRILDLGTGTGCLLVALLTEFPSAWGLGMDRSPGASIAARSNAERNGVGDRAAFAVGDWSRAIRARFELVVSNPPYIETKAISSLGTEVRDHDPPLALDGGGDGLDAYRELMDCLPHVLVPGGYAILELGAGQEQMVAALADSTPGLRICGPAKPDLGGVPRALVLRCVQGQA